MLRRSKLSVNIKKLLGLQLKTKPINVALKDMVLIQYWELHVHITTHETTDVQKYFK